MTVHAITFPVPEDRASAPEVIQAMPWHSWGRNNQNPAGDYWNMVWSQRLGVRHHFADENRPLLLLNEPEYAWQADMNPVQVADCWTLYADYAGPVYIGGYGYDYLDQFQEARDIYQGPEYWTGLHLHVYALPWEWRDNPQAVRTRLRMWRDEAGELPIALSEWGFLPVTGWYEYAAGELADLWQCIAEELAPPVAFWFSYRMPDASQDTGDVHWQTTNAADGVIGQRWRSIADAYDYRYWFPLIQQSH